MEIQAESSTRLPTSECRVSDKKEILFEYNDGITDKFCDVVFKSSTKSETSEENVFCNFIFQRSYVNSYIIADITRYC